MGRTSNALPVIPVGFSSKESTSDTWFNESKAVLVASLDFCVVYPFVCVCVWGLSHPGPPLALLMAFTCSKTLVDPAFGTLRRDVLHCEKRSKKRKKERKKEGEERKKQKKKNHTHILPPLSAGLPVVDQKLQVSVRLALCLCSQIPVAPLTQATQHQKQPPHHCCFVVLLCACKHKARPLS